MENTTGAGALRVSRRKIFQAAALITFTMVICRGPLLVDSFTICISLIAYMLSQNTINLYLIIPAAAGMIPYISKGYEPQPYIAAMLVCGLVFVAVRRMKFTLWQRSVITSAASITAMSIYRLATGTIYMASPGRLILEGALIAAGIYLFHAFYSVVQSADDRMLTPELCMVSFACVCLLLINGIGITFLLWMYIVFLALWVLVCLDAGTALIVTSAGSLAAALIGEAQWGLMATLMLGILAASLAKNHGIVLRTAVFAAVCWIAGFAESGVVLGIDKYCLILPTLAFLVLYWKFGDRMRHIIYAFARKNDREGENFDNHAEAILKDKVACMNDLTELYSTYLDSRSMLANQFNITRQIIEDARWQLSRPGRKSAAKENDKFEVDIAISQCAAAGAINGDCCGWQDIGGGRIAMVVSDGMGKGKKAASESLMVTKTMMSLLKSGVTTDLALKMINTIMLMKEDEDSYATLDMVTIDKRSGKAKFYKIGAAPTLIRRKSNVEEVKLSAVPLGIVNGLKVRYVETTLKKDDWIIMMSDGVSDGGDHRVHSSEGSVGRNDKAFLHKIKETAADVRSQDPQTMSDLILNQAADSYIGRERDDLTVMVARIL